MCKESDQNKQIELLGTARTTGMKIGILKVLYCITTFFSLFMVAWIVIFPSSWLMGRSDFHDHIVNEAFIKTYDGTQVPPGTVTKYAGHSLIQFTHILPGAIWAGAIPFQLHPTMRQTYRKVHRVSGYAFLTSSILMAIGILVILARDLTFHNDYPSHIPPADDAELLQMKTSITVLTGWFVYTALAAVVKARSKDFEAHRAFVVRHVGSGIWIALQRIIVVCFQGLGLVSGPLQMRNLFGSAVTGSTCLTILASEYAIRLLKKDAETAGPTKSKHL
mmetsp:Transcript_32906/g.72189  ORF Transcript_32906/g.72189 Transcript_32906/m.72189 type:complete len:277 (+) Transcript_32906:510-1340(+)